VEIRKADLEDVFIEVMSRHGDKAGTAAPARTGRDNAELKVAGVEAGSS
jgi:hypothetical protein